MTQTAEDMHLALHGLKGITFVIVLVNTILFVSKTHLLMTWTRRLWAICSDLLFSRHTTTSTAPEQIWNQLT